MQWFPFLRWPRPSPRLLGTEALAGLTVGLMVIPQGVAYAALAHMPLVTGIYASLLPALVAVLFGASSRLAVGPTALSCLMVSASLAGLAEPASADWVSLAIWLSLLSGVLQIGLGAARFGWVLNLVSAPVLKAFTQAAGILIISSQLPMLLGVHSSWAEFAQHPKVHLTSLLFGCVSLAILVLLRRWRPTFPTVLIVVLVSAYLSQALQFEQNGGMVVGALPQGFPALSLPGGLPVEQWAQLFMPVLAITLVSFLETASSASVDNDQRGQLWDQDQDLIGQGLAKIASALSGAFPTSSSFSRSALNLYAGAQSGWATVFSVAVVALTLLFFLPLLVPVPQAVLAAIVVVAVVGLIRPGEFLRLWRISRVEACIAASTFVATLLFAPRLYWGVLLGVTLALSHFLYLRLHPRIIEVGLHADGRLRDRHLWNLPVLAPHTYALRMDAALDFGSANELHRAITAYLGAHPDTRTVVLLALAINRIDVTGVEAFARLHKQLAAQDRCLVVVNLKLPVERLLQAAGELKASPQLRLIATEAELLEQLQQGEIVPHSS